MNEDERAIRELIDTWMRASIAGDVETVLSLMTDDVVFMTPGKPPFGKREFAATSEGMRTLKLAGDARIEECRIIGEWAYLRNYLKMTITPEGGATVRRSGHTLTILRKEADGKWRLARDANLLTEDPPAQA
ncbi:MAG TPA: SgcJ/EcaC family oxidoreductase [Oxalicibacterium sp.]|nr:SgcJ/EcaC family oxidoreductase [Oxalicibacterium sp.]